MVFDETGAFMPNVNVTLDTGASKRDLKTDDAGRFRLADVAAGDHILEATRPGFRIARHELKLREAEDWRRTITMIVGDLSETIHVSARRNQGLDVARPATRGGSIRPPQRKNRDVYPEYPGHLRAAGLEAEVRLEAAVGSDGKVSWVRALQSNVHPDFVNAAIECVKQWTYEPTRLNGVPIGVYMTATIVFRLE